MEELELTPDDRAVLARLGVTLMVLFGSRAQGVASPTSDYDIGVLAPHNKAVYDAVYDLVSARANQLVNVDVVFLNEAPLELQAHVAKYGTPLYQQSTSALVDFRERVMTQYADFAPLRRLFQHATLARITP
jgi:predicted nucleotidyltransferase